jgi:hypothetical protein
MFTFANKARLLRPGEHTCVTVRQLAMTILFTVCIIPVGASELPLNSLISVTLGVLDRYHPTCVYLLHSTHQQGECFTFSFNWHSINWKTLNLRNSLYGRHFIRNIYE